MTVANTESAGSDREILVSRTIHAPRSFVFEMYTKAEHLAHWWGSAKLSDSLMAAGLFDEYRLCLAPIVLGEGTPLFKPHNGPHRMRLLESRALSTGGIILRYAPHREA